MDGVSVPFGILKRQVIKGLRSFRKEMFLSILLRSEKARLELRKNNLRYNGIGSGVEYCVFYPDQFEAKYDIKPFALVRSCSSTIVESIDLLFEFDTSEGIRQFNNRLFSIGPRPIRIVFHDMLPIDFRSSSKGPFQTVSSLRVYTVTEKGKSQKDHCHFTGSEVCNWRNIQMFGVPWHIGWIQDEVELMLEYWRTKNTVFRLLSRILFDTAVARVPTRKYLALLVIFWARNRWNRVLS